MLKKKFSIFVLIFSILNFSCVFAQDFEKLSAEICVSFIQNDTIPNKKYEEAINSFLSSQPENNKLSISFINNFSFRLQQSLIKNCDFFADSDYSFFPNSNIADLENVFNYEETEQIQTQIKNIKSNYKLEVFIVTTENYFPKSNIDDYSFSILNSNSNQNFEKGSLIFVINKKERNIRISTNETAKKLIDDEFCSNLIEKIIVPNFKEKKYYLGIEKSLIELERKAKK